MALVCLFFSLLSNVNPSPQPHHHPKQSESGNTNYVWVTILDVLLKLLPEVESAYVELDFFGRSERSDMKVDSCGEGVDIFFSPSPDAAVPCAPCRRASRPSLRSSAMWRYVFIPAMCVYVFRRGFLFSVLTDSQSLSQDSTPTFRPDAQHDGDSVALFAAVRTPSPRTHHPRTNSRSSLWDPKQNMGALGSHLTVIVACQRRTADIYFEFLNGDPLEVRIGWRTLCIAACIRQSPSLPLTHSRG